MLFLTKIYTTESIYLIYIKLKSLTDGIYMKKISKFFTCALVGLFSINLPLVNYACSNIVLKADNDDVTIGRTMEFASNLNSSIFLMPKSSNIQTQLGDSTPGMAWETKYSYLYFNGFNLKFAVDGMNDQGLSFGYLYLPGETKYPKYSSNQAAENTIPYYHLGDWVLSNFKTVDEVKKAIKNINIVSVPLSNKEHKNIVFPLHADITDANGNSIVIEFINEKVVITDNKVGVLTNSPTFDWQVKNLANFINLSPYSPESITLDGYQYSGTGQGSGMVGIPGDASPPSRFAKLAMILKTVTPPKNASEGNILAINTLDTVFIPKGFVRGNKNADPKTSYDYTQWTVIKDLTNKKLLFRSYNNPNYTEVTFDTKIPANGVTVNRPFHSLEAEQAQ